MTIGIRPAMLVALIVLVGGLAAFVLRASRPSAGQSSTYRAQRLAGTDHPDLSGLWQALTSANWDIEPHMGRAALALRTGAPVIPVFALPLPGGRFRMVYEHPVEQPRGEGDDAIRDFTQRCTDVLEMYVRRYPELWLWMHRRWRDGPAGETVAGMFPLARGENGSADE